VLFPTLGMAEVDLVSSEVDVRYLQQTQVFTPKGQPSKQEDRGLVAQAFLPADKASERAGGNALPLRASLLTPPLLDLAHRVCRDAVDAVGPLEEGAHDVRALVERLGIRIAPVALEEVEHELGAFLAGEGLERVEVGIAKREQAPHGLVGKERVRLAARETLGTQEPPPLLPERMLAIALVAHSFGLAHYPRRQRERQGILGGEARKLRHFAFPPWPLRAVRIARTRRLRAVAVACSGVEIRGRVTPPPSSPQRGF